MAFESCMFQMDVILGAHLAVTAIGLVLLRRPAWVPAMLDVAATAVLVIAQFFGQFADPSAAARCPWAKPALFAVMDVATDMQRCDRTDMACVKLALNRFRWGMLAAAAVWAVVKMLAGLVPVRPQTELEDDDADDDSTQPTQQPVPASPASPASHASPTTHAPHAAAGTTNGRFDHCSVGTAIWGPVTINAAGQRHRTRDTPNLTEALARFDASQYGA
jgi:hypothetical protein